MKKYMKFECGQCIKKKCKEYRQVANLHIIDIQDSVRHLLSFRLNCVKFDHDTNIQVTGTGQI